MTDKTCINCPGATDHDTAHCPLGAHVRAPLMREHFAPGQEGDKHYAQCLEAEGARECPMCAGMVAIPLACLLPYIAGTVCDKHRPMGLAEYHGFKFDGVAVVIKHKSGEIEKTFTPIDEEGAQGEREAFEAHYLALPYGSPNSYDLARLNDGSYKFAAMRQLWDFWQARAALAQPSPDVPYADGISADLERPDWTPEEALQWYAQGNHFDVVGGRTRIIDTGAIASNALKHLSLPYLEMKGDAELTELREATTRPSPAPEYNCPSCADTGFVWTETGEQYCPNCPDSKPSPAPELERPESILRFTVDSDSEYLEVVRGDDFDRIVGALRAENAKLSEALDRWPHIRDALKLKLDAAQARVDVATKILRNARNRVTGGLHIVISDFLAGKAPVAQAGQVPDVSAMARVLSDRQADACNVDRDDQWKLYGNDFIEDVKAMLAAAPAQGGEA